MTEKATTDDWDFYGEVGEVVHRITRSIVGVKGDWGGWTIRVEAEPGDGGTHGSLTIEGPADVEVNYENPGEVTLSMLGGEWSELARVLRVAASEVEKSNPDLNNPSWHTHLK
jgi:hypothetical protein